MSIFKKKPNKPIKPSMPTANYSEMYYEGTISDTIPILGSPVYTPGTYQEAYNGLPLLTPSVYPVYNEVLGQFALLTKPEIDITEYEESTNEMCPDNDCLLHGVWYQNYNKRILKLRLTDSLKYKFNPALDFDTTKTELYGSFIITMSGIVDPTNDSLIIRQYLDKSEMYLAHDLITGTERKLIVETPWLKVEKLLNRLFTMNIENSNGCICGVYPGTLPPNVHPVQAEQLAESIDKIEFKLMADMYFNQLNFHEDQNNTTQVFTYLLYDKDNSNGSLNTANFIHNNGSTWERPYVPGTLTIASPINITPSSPQVIHQNGDTLFINAENIVINNSVTVASGYIAVFQGVYSVRVGPDGHLSPKIILRINDFGQSEISDVNQTYLDNYCTGAVSSSYHANVASRGLRRRMAEESETDYSKTKNHSSNTNSVSISPNPANSQIRISSSSKPISEIQIFDLSGRSLIQKKTGNDFQQVEVDINKLQSGVYIVQTICGDERSSEKLVVSK